MRASDGTPLAPAQAAAAANGAKALMPVGDGRPFMDYVLTSLANAGLTDVCVVVAPGDQSVRQRYSSDIALRRVSIAFAVQSAPVGTANALLACASFVGNSPFVVVNADNYYPADGLRLLADAGGPATLAFSRAGLLRDGLIDADRLARYALLEVNDDGYLTDVIEKPDSDTFARYSTAPISMNIWRFDPDIFRACRDVPRSVRGEFELPMAVQFAVRDLGMRVRALPIDAPVLDLSRRADIPSVISRLDAVQVSL